MSKTLSVIQTFFKIGKILSKVAFIIFVVGFSMSLVALVCVNLGLGELLHIGDVSIYGIISEEVNLPDVDLNMTLVYVMISIVVQAVICKFAECAFAKELESGTPFSDKFAQDTKRLGILLISLPIGAYILMQIIAFYVSCSIGQIPGPENEFEPSLTMGIMFIIMSFVFKYGAEREAAHLDGDGTYYVED